jgi:hypothetical protein
LNPGRRGGKLATNRLNYGAATVQWLLKAAYPDFPCEICPVVLPNIPTSPCAKLKMSLENHLPDFVY